MLIMNESTQTRQNISSTSTITTTMESCTNRQQTIILINDQPLTIFLKRNYLSLMIILISTIVIIAPFISFRSLITFQPNETQIILHPFDVTKDIIQDVDYAIVIDGGSTGTRIHIFSFLINNGVKQQKIILHDESYFYIKPGLSSYAHNISQAATSLEPLLTQAFKHVPTSLMPQTPLILKATAGLRLLPDESANQILDTVEYRLKSSPFKGIYSFYFQKYYQLLINIYSVQHDAVSMLDDRDEGLFGWYTVNFLLNRLHNISQSAATLDLGGGSTQVTFSTNDMNTLVMSPPGRIAKHQIEGEPEYIYTHSYLGNGLMSARYSILLEHSHGQQSVEKPGLIGNRLYVRSPCFKSLTNGTNIWKFNDNWFHISHHQNSYDPFEDCYEQVANFVIESRIDQPKELAHREVYAMSYFYDRMKDIRVLKHEQGYIKVRDYFRYAEHICNGMIKFKKQSPFLCLDLTYIASYLHDGLGLPLHKDILVCD